MASAQDTVLSQLLDDLVRAFGAGDTAATQTMIDTFVTRQANEGQIELMNRGSGYYDALRQLVNQTSAARSRGDAGAIAAELNAFKARHQGVPMLVSAGERVCQHLETGSGGAEMWTQFSVPQIDLPTAAAAAPQVPVDSPELTQALARADEAIEYGILREAIRAVGTALEIAPADPRIAGLLQTLLNRSPGLAPQVRNLLEPFENRLGREGTEVMLRVRGLIDQNLFTNIRMPGMPGDAPTSAATRFDEPPTAHGNSNGVTNGTGMPVWETVSSVNNPGPSSPSSGPPAPPVALPSDPHTDQLWEQAMSLLSEGKIHDMIRLLRMIPQGDRHYLPAQAYLETYRPGDREMQRVAVELARLVVQNVGTLLNLKDRRSLEQVRDRMVAARRLIDEYNTTHPDRPMEYPRRIDELEETALRGLQAYAAWDRAEWGLNAGLPAEAMGAFHEFTRLEQNRAALPESLSLRDRILHLARAIEVAQRFQGVGIGADLATLGMTRDEADQACQVLIACAASAQRQAQQDAMQPPMERARVTMQHVSMIEEYRDLLRLGLQLLDLKPKAMELRQIIPTAESVTSSYESFKTSSEELRELIWQYETSARPSLQQLCIGAASYVRNVLEGEVNTLLAAAATPGLADVPFRAFVDQAHALLQLATSLEVGAQRLGTSPDPRSAQSQSIRSLAERIEQARRQRSMHNFTVRVLQPIAVIAGVVVLLGALFMFTPLQDVAQQQYTQVFPPPTATPVKPLEFSVDQPDARTLQQPPACEYDNGFNVCDDADGATFMTRRKQNDWYFGHPISPRMQDAARPNVWVQYFEGGRLELDTFDQKKEVRFGNLGDELLKLGEYAPLVATAGARVAPNSVPGGRFVPGPNIHVARELVDLYDKYTADLFGLPVLEATIEEREGKQWRVQWFQRTRMEAEVETTPNPNRQVRFSPVGREYLIKVLNINPR